MSKFVKTSTRPTTLPQTMPAILNDFHPSKIIDNILLWVEGAFTPMTITGRTVAITDDFMIYDDSIPDNKVLELIAFKSLDDGTKANVHAYLHRKWGVGV